MSDILTMSNFSVAPWELGADELAVGAEVFDLYAPLGFDGGDGNLYRYVGNDPVDYTDPTGLYKLNFKGGNWSGPQQQAVQNMLNTILAKLNTLIRDIEADYAKIPEGCFKDAFAYHVNDTLRVLKKMRDGINSNDPLDIYHKPFKSYVFGLFGLDPTADAVTVGTENYWVNPPSVYLNDSRGWQSNPTGYILPVLFHELSHIYGTIDDPSPFLYALNATEFQGLFSLGLNSTYYETMKKNGTIQV